MGVYEVKEDFILRLLRLQEQQYYFLLYLIEFANAGGTLKIE